MAILRFIVKKQTRMNDCDGYAAPVRTLAASAGIQFDDLQVELYRLRDQLGPDHKKAYDESIRRLARGGAISEAEQRALLDLGARGFAVGSEREFEKFRSYAQALHKRMLGDPGATPVALAIVGVVANYAVPTKPGRRSRVLARAAKHPIRNILLGVAGGAFGGLRMSGWNPIGGVVGGVVGGIIAAVESLC
jgi:hypothetical protein